jgi:uncharacterized protein (UPF0332 family)
MTWNQLLQRSRVQLHSTNKQEIDNLRQVVARGLADAAVTAISPDLRFQAAYNAVLQLATIVILCAGYRVRGREHHRTTFEALPIAMGNVVATQAAYFDTCRQKRNITTYDQTGLVSVTEVEDLLKQAASFQHDVEQWIRDNHPHLALA